MITILTKNELEKIYRQHYKYMTIVANNILHDYEASEDAVGEAFVQLLENNSKGIEIRNVKCWLISVSRFTAYRHLKGYKKAIILPITDIINVIGIEDFSYRINLSLDMHRLYSALRLRNPSWHDCFFLHCNEKMSTKEISDKLHITESAVSNNIYKAKKFMQGKCKESDYYPNTMLLIFIIYIASNSRY